MIAYHRLAGWPRLPIFLVAGHRLLADACRRVVAQVVAARRLRARRGLHVRDPRRRARRRAGHRRPRVGRRRAARRQPPPSTAQPASSPMGCASVSTSAARSPRPSPSTSTLAARSSPRPSCRRRTTHAARASPPASSTWSPRSPRSVGAERVDLVTHSTTQAVNALLEGDVGTVGVHRPRPAARPRARPASAPRSSRVELVAGQAAAHACPSSSTSPTVSTRRGPRGARPRCRAARRGRGLRRRGVRARRRHATSAASPQLGARGRAAGLRVDRAAPGSTASSCAPSPPRSTRRSCRSPSAPPRSSSRACAAAGIASPVMVMRGDGGATDLAGFRRGAGPHALLRPGGVGRRRAALRAASTTASSSRSAARRPTSPPSATGGPRCRTSQVASHATALRAVDVRVIGVAGGSMLRVAAAAGVYGVGPRSAHIAGLPYACFAARPTPRRRDAVEFAPREPATRPTTSSLESADGRRVGPHQHVRGERARRRRARRLRRTATPRRPRRVRGRRRGARASRRRGRAAACSRRRRRRSCELVARGGRRPPSCTRPDDRRRRRRRRRARPPRRRACSASTASCPTGAEVISSIGDALSLVRAERERTVAAIDAADLRRLAGEVEAEVLAAGARRPRSRSASRSSPRRAPSGPSPPAPSGSAPAPCPGGRPRMTRGWPAPSPSRARDAGADRRLLAGPARARCAPRVSCSTASAI